MRVLQNLSAVAISIFCISIVSSCKKRVTEKPQASVMPQSPAATSSVCKPEVLASLGDAFIDGSIWNNVWNNIMQRWFIAGKVAYLKADLGYGFNTPEVPPRIKWGVAVYENNFVFLRDAGRGSILILRVMLDDLDRPVKSEYFDPDGMETATYVYNPSGELATVTFQRGAANQVYTFSYDDKGDLSEIESPVSVTIFQYDYNKPVGGMMGLHGVNAHLKLMEYMDLVEMPVKYQLLSVVTIPGPHGGKFEWDYTKIRLFAGSLVYSFECPSLTFAGNIYYVGWTCDGPLSRAKDNVLEKEITSVEEFRRRYPNANVSR